MCAIELSLREAQQVEARQGRATADAGGASTPSRTPPRDARGGGGRQPAPEPEPAEQELEPESEPSAVAAPQSLPASEPAPSSAEQATCIHRP